MKITSLIPPEYRGREQTFLKHMVLREYLSSWVQKLGRTGRPGETVQLWYVDCFAGPWQAKGQQLEDTSIAIGLGALDEALESPGLNVAASAIFIERESGPFRQLKTFLLDRESKVTTLTLHGEFGDYVDEINSHVADDPAFIFIDPTGWKGVGMGFVVPLLQRARRDVLVNVMFNYVNRFKGDSREFLRTQMGEFFGLDDASGLKEKTELELMEIYRTKLKEHSGSKYSLYIAIPHSIRDRTWFYLVVAGSNPALVQLFRRVEAKVVGAVAGEVRGDAMRRASDARGQGAFHFGDRLPDHRYEKLNRAALEAVPAEIERMLGESNGIQFHDLWPHVLERHHITLAELGKLIVTMHMDGRLRVEGMKGNERTPKNRHWIRGRK